MYITAGSPNKRSLGAVNGLAMTLASISRMLTHAIASSLLAFSIQYQILWGYAAYIVFVFFTIGGIRLASELPMTIDTSSVVAEVDDCWCSTWTWDAMSLEVWNPGERCRRLVSWIYIGTYWPILRLFTTKEVINTSSFHNRVSPSTLPLFPRVTVASSPANR